MLIFLLFGVAIATRFEYIFNEAGYHCVHDLLAENVLVSGSFITQSKELVVSITDPDGEPVIKHSTSNPNDPQSFTFVVRLPGNYSFCMIAYSELKVQVTIRKGAQALDLDEIPKRGEIYSIEENVQSLHQVLELIKMQMRFNIDRENNNQYDSADNNLVTFSITCTAALIVTSYLTMRLMKTYFIRKKYI